MKIILLLLILMAATFFAGCAAPSAHGTSGVVATVSCSDPSMRFTGTIVSDGHAKQVSGTGSRSFHLTGHELDFSFKKAVPDGRISLTVTKAGQCVATATTDSRFGGVRGHVLLRQGVAVQQEASSF